MKPNPFQPSLPGIPPPELKPVLPVRPCPPYACHACLFHPCDQSPQPCANWQAKHPPSQGPPAPHKEGARASCARTNPLALHKDSYDEVDPYAGEAPPDISRPQNGGADAKPRSSAPATPQPGAGGDLYQTFVMVLNPQPLPRTVARAMTSISLVWVIRTTRSHHRWPPNQDIHYWHDQEDAEAICQALNQGGNPFAQRGPMARARILNHARRSTKALK